VTEATAAAIVACATAGGGKARRRAQGLTRRVATNAPRVRCVMGPGQAARDDYVIPIGSGREILGLPRLRGQRRLGTLLSFRERRAVVWNVRLAGHLRTGEAPNGSQAAATGRARSLDRRLRNEVHGSNAPRSSFFCIPPGGNYRGGDGGVSEARRHPPAGRCGRRIQITRRMTA
jgi:hypothetical protein